MVQGLVPLGVGPSGEEEEELLLVSSSPPRMALLGYPQPYKPLVGGAQW